MSDFFENLVEVALDTNVIFSNVSVLNGQFLDLWVENKVLHGHVSGHLEIHLKSCEFSISDSLIGDKHGDNAFNVIKVTNNNSSFGIKVDWGLSSVWHQSDSQRNVGVRSVPLGDNWESLEESLGHVGISFNVWEERTLSDTHKRGKHALVDEQLLGKGVVESFWEFSVLFDWETFMNCSVFSFVEKTIKVDLNEVVGDRRS